MNSSLIEKSLLCYKFEEKVLSSIMLDQELSVIL
jgi:hypothetical protein